MGEYLANISYEVIFSLLRKNIKSPENQNIIDKIIKEVRGLNPSYEAASIRGVLKWCKSYCIN